MALLPFTVALQETVSANGTVTFSYQAPTNQELLIYDLLHSSTGIFDITSIRDSEGIRYSSASNSDPIENIALKDVADDYNSVELFKEPLVLRGGVTLLIDVLDTSTASNTINMYLVCKRDIKSAN